MPGIDYFGILVLNFLQMYVFSVVHRPLPLVEVTGYALWEERRRIGGGNAHGLSRHLDQRERST